MFIIKIYPYVKTIKTIELINTAKVVSIGLQLYNAVKFILLTANGTVNSKKIMAATIGLILNREIE